MLYQGMICGFIGLVSHQQIGCSEIRLRTEWSTGHSITPDLESTVLVEGHRDIKRDDVEGTDEGYGLQSFRFLSNK